MKNVFFGDEKNSDSCQTSILPGAADGSLHERIGTCCCCCRVAVTLTAAVTAAEAESLGCLELYGDKKFKTVLFLWRYE